jgi:hypothetical protein
VWRGDLVRAGLHPVASGLFLRKDGRSGGGSGEVVEGKRDKANGTQ